MMKGHKNRQELMPISIRLHRIFNFCLYADANNFLAADY